MINYNRNNLFIGILYIFHSTKYMQYEVFLVFWLWAGFVKRGLKQKRIWATQVNRKYDATEKCKKFTSGWHA